MGRAHPDGAAMIPRPDYHTHLENVGLTWDGLMRLVEAALRVGVTEIGLTEHAHNFVQCRTIYPPDNPWIHAREVPERRNWDFDAYVRLLDRARAEGLPVKAGMEWDYCPGREGELERWIQVYDWDFTLGGVHWLRGKDGSWWGFDIPDQQAEWENRPVDEVYAEYFRLLAEAAQTGLFDVLAHPDVVKVFGHRPDQDPLPWYEEAARAMAQAGVCAEVSTAGLRKPVGELYPAAEFLRVLHRRAIPIVTSSDAHLPEHVGYAFDQAEAAARAAGYQTRCLFTRRRRTEVPIPLGNI